MIVEMNRFKLLDRKIEMLETLYTRLEDLLDEVYEVEEALDKLTEEYEKVCPEEVNDYYNSYRRIQFE